MDETIHTLQDFMLRTESVTYIIMGLSLICVLAFWLFLTENDED